MQTPLKTVATWENVTREVLENDIVPRYDPAILKGYVKGWPIVKSAKESDEAVCDYLTSHYIGGNVRFARLAAEHNGVFTYNEDMTGFNFSSGPSSLLKEKMDRLKSFFKKFIKTQKSIQKH